MALILFGVFIALLLLGVPVAFAICSAAATTMFAGFGTAKMMIVVQRMFASCDSFSLIAVPFFIFAGDLLAGGKISKVLVEFCESLLGMIKGGLSVVSVLAGMFFAAISGSGAATTWPARSRPGTARRRRVHALPHRAFGRGGLAVGHAGAENRARLR